MLINIILNGIDLFLMDFNFLCLWTYFVFNLLIVDYFPSEMEQLAHNYTHPRINKVLWSFLFNHLFWSE